MKRTLIATASAIALITAGLVGAAPAQAAVKPVEVLGTGHGTNAAINAGVDAGLDGKVLFSVAAGSGSADSCNYAPAGTEIAALSGDANATVDSRAYFSNPGVCNDIFAPGLSIGSAGFTGVVTNATPNSITYGGVTIPAETSVQLTLLEEVTFNLSLALTTVSVQYDPADGLDQ
jgi:hypothetical protein